MSVRLFRGYIGCSYRTSGECRALCSVYRALLSVYRALLSAYRALLSVYRALLSVYGACEKRKG